MLGRLKLGSKLARMRVMINTLHQRDCDKKDSSIKGERGKGRGSLFTPLHDDCARVNEISTINIIASIE